MYKTSILPPEVLEKVADKSNTDNTLIHDDFFIGLCWREIEYLMNSVKLDEFNRLLIALHCAGCTDKKIADGLRTYLPHACTETNTKEVNIKERRRDVIRRIAEKNGESVGLITVMHKAFKGKW